MAMEQGFTIKEVAHMTGLSDHTLRYYERIGLLDPVERVSNGHRRYSSQDVAWIEFLNRLRVTGLPIRHMQEFADYRRQGDATIHERRILLENHEQALLKQIADLEAHLTAIRDKIQHYKTMEVILDADQ
jgi:DNA-binding transcriptional MerR regulator